MNILVLTDFSNDAYNALFYAAQLYKDKQCNFHIMHIYDRHSDLKNEYAIYQGEKSLKQFLSDRADECLKETRHRIIGDTENNPLHKYSIIPIYDTLIKGVKSYIRNNAVDLMVMGNKGRSGAKEIFYGGNTIQMVKSKISCPLLCIPKEIDFKTISQIGYITDYKHPLSNNNLWILKSLSQQSKAIVHVIHVGESDKQTAQQENSKAALTRIFEGIDLQFHDIARSKSKAKTIAAYVESHRIDLLAMTYYPHYLLTKLFREPVVLDLSIYLDTPLLVLADQE